MNAAMLVAVMAGTTALIRFLPFIVFRKKTPSYIVSLGRVLPPAMIGMLVVFCLKDVNFAFAPHGLPELAAAVSVFVLQKWKRSALISIIGGTLLYMALIRLFG